MLGCLELILLNQSKFGALAEKLVPVSKMVIFNPKSDQHLISPNSKMAVSFIKIMRVKEMITTQRSFDC